MNIILVILFLFCNFQCSNTDEKILLKIYDFYNLNKDRDFKNFRNWHIWRRENQAETYIFDYLTDEKIDFRFLVVKDSKKGNILYKQITPKRDSLFFELKENINDNGLTLNLYLEFKYLNVDALYYLNEHKMILFEFKSYNILYSEIPNINLLVINRFNKYKQIDSNWFYIIKEKN